jgi:hypothetical protein
MRSRLRLVHFRRRQSSRNSSFNSLRLPDSICDVGTRRGVFVFSRRDVNVLRTVIIAARPWGRGCESFTPELMSIAPGPFDRRTGDFR